MTGVCRFSKAAERDLLQVFAYIAQDNLDRATSFTDELIDRCMGLALFPGIGLVDPNGRSSDRLVIHQNYLIYYRPLPQNTGVLIKRILNAKQRRP